MVDRIGGQLGVAWRGLCARIEQALAYVAGPESGPRRARLLRRGLAAGHAGQSMVEYGIVVALIAIVAFATIQLLGGRVQDVFQSILDSLRTVPLGPGSGT